MFRRDSLCSGEANCADAVKIRDEAGELVDRDRCSTCPLTGLEAAMTSSVGRTIQRVADIDAQLQWGGGGDIDNLPCGEFYILKTIRAERDRLQQQQRSEHA